MECKSEASLHSHEEHSRGKGVCTGTEVRKNTGVETKKTKRAKKSSFLSVVFWFLLSRSFVFFVAFHVFFVSFVLFVSLIPP